MEKGDLSAFVFLLAQGRVTVLICFKSSWVIIICYQVNNHFSKCKGSRDRTYKNTKEVNTKIYKMRTTSIKDERKKTAGSLGRILWNCVQVAAITTPTSFYLYLSRLSFLLCEILCLKWGGKQTNKTSFFSYTILEKLMLLLWELVSFWSIHRKYVRAYHEENCIFLSK